MGVIRINLTLPEDLLNKLDSYCEKYSYDRSEFLKSLIRTKLFVHVGHQIEEPAGVSKEPVEQDVKGLCAVCGYFKLLSTHTYIDPRTLERETKGICIDCLKKARATDQLRDEE